MTSPARLFLGSLGVLALVGCSSSDAFNDGPTTS